MLEVFERLGKKAAIAMQMSPDDLQIDAFCKEFEVHVFFERGNYWIV